MTDIKYDENVLGSSRFSTEKEIKSSGLINNGEGIVLGKIGSTLIEKPAGLQGHCLIVGGTGTGKSRGISIPTLLKWPGAVFCIDVKGELSSLTSKYRQGKVYIFEPEKGTDPYDPLKECQTVDAAQDLARTLIPEPQSGDPFWAKTAQGILAAAIFEGALNSQSLVDVIEKVCTIKPEELIEQLQGSQNKAVKMLSSVGVGMPEKTLGGVFAELRSNLLTLGADPNIEKATSTSTWTPETLEEGATIYLKVSEKMIAQYKSLWTVIVSQILRHLSDRPERANPPILLLLDELPRLGKLNGLLEALATLRSRNVHIVMCIQSMAQLDAIYGKDERKVIADNCGYKLVLSATDSETQKYFSDIAGYKTVWAGSKGKSEQQKLFAAENINQGLSQHSTPLIRPEEFGRLDQPILFSPNIYPAKIQKAYWDKTSSIAKITGLNVEDEKKPKVKNKSVKLGNLYLYLGLLPITTYIQLSVMLQLIKYSMGLEFVSKLPEEQRQIVRIIAAQDFVNLTVVRELFKIPGQALDFTKGLLLYNLILFGIILLFKKLFVSNKNDF